MSFVGPQNLGTISGHPVQFRFGITFWIPRIYRIFSRPSNEDRLSYRNVHPVLDTETIFYHRRILCGRVILSVFHSLPLSFFFFLSRMTQKEQAWGKRKDFCRWKGGSFIPVRRHTDSLKNCQQAAAILPSTLRSFLPSFLPTPFASW